MLKSMDAGPEVTEFTRGIESLPPSDMNGLMTRQPLAGRQTRGNPSLSDLDWAILGELTLDPHASPRLLAERLNLPASQVASRVRNLDRRNVSHVLAVLDLKASGQSFCFLHMGIRGRPAEEVATKAASIPEVLMVSTLSGGAHDLLLLIRFTDTDKLYRLIYEDIAPIEGVARFFVSVVVDIPIFKSNYVNYTTSTSVMGVEENMSDLALNYKAEEMD